jgi:hypothetical protein
VEPAEIPAALAAGQPAVETVSLLAALAAG